MYYDFRVIFFCGNISLTYKRGFTIFTGNESKILL